METIKSAKSSEIYLHNKYLSIKHELEGNASIPKTIGNFLGDMLLEHYREQLRKTYFSPEDDLKILEHASDNQVIREVLKNALHAFIIFNDIFINVYPDMDKEDDRYVQHMYDVVKNNYDLMNKLFKATKRPQYVDDLYEELIASNISL